MRESLKQLETLARNAGRNISWEPERYGEDLLRQIDHELSVFLSQLPEGSRDFYEVEYINRCRQWLNSLSRTFSVAITGGSNFNNRRHEKTNNAERKAYENLHDWMAKAIKRANRKQRLTGWEEVERLQVKLESLTELQESMKMANKVLRSKKMTDEEKIDELVSLGFSESKSMLMIKPNELWGLGFPRYMLTNNLAKIKSTKESITRHERMANTPSTDHPFNGGVVRLDMEDERIRIFFDEKPEEDERKRLKAEGFRWSPSHKAWQRQLTQNAMSALRRLFINRNLDV